MNKQMDEFLSEGMTRYRQAAATMVSFGEEIETRLKRILSIRTAEEWKPFIRAEDVKAKSTNYWSKYPLLNAKIEGKFGEAALKITIEICWYDSESHYPSLGAYVKPPIPDGKTLWDEFEWRGEVYRHDYGIRLNPDEDDFNLERDIGILLDELVRFLGEQAG